MVLMAAMLSPSPNATALQGSLNWNVNSHFPLDTSHSLVLLSAEAVMSRLESTAQQTAVRK